MCVCLYSYPTFPACKSHLFQAILHCNLWPVWLYNIFPRYLIHGKNFDGKKSYHHHTACTAVNCLLRGCPWLCFWRGWYFTIQCCSLSLSHDKWVPVTTAWRILKLQIEEWPPIWRVAANILNKQSQDIYYTTSLSWDSKICFQIMRSGITACERLTFLSGDLP